MAEARLFLEALHDALMLGRAGDAEQIQKELDDLCQRRQYEGSILVVSLTEVMGEVEEWFRELAQDEEDRGNA